MLAVLGSAYFINVWDDQLKGIKYFFHNALKMYCNSCGKSLRFAL